MSNQGAAVNALAWARGKTSTFKSANKFYNEKTDLAKYKRRYEASLYRGQIEKEAPLRGATMEDIAVYAGKVLNVAHGAANCGELASLVCAYLSNGEVVPLFDFIILEAPGDHAFVALGQPTPDNGIYPFNFDDWDDDAWICDPWANLACTAQEYPTQWQAKMGKWKTAGKLLAKPGTEYEGQLSYVSPTDPYWFNGLTECNKLSLTYKPLVAVAPRNKKCGCCCTLF